MKALILDLETTGLDNQKDEVTEFAVMLWEPIPDRIIDVMTARVAVSKYDVNNYTEEVERLTGIKKSDLREGISQESFQAWMKKFISRSDWMIAHHAAFDCSWLDFNIDKPVMDSVTAIPPSKSRKSNSLQAITEFHNIKRPLGAHRAILDVFALYEVLKLYKWDLLVERANSPQIREVVVMDYEEFKITPEEERPKAFGYKWDENKKEWFRNCLEIDLEPVRFPFKTRIVRET